MAPPILATRGHRGHTPLGVALLAPARPHPGKKILYSDKSSVMQTKQPDPNEPSAAELQQQNETRRCQRAEREKNGVAWEVHHRSLAATFGRLAVRHRIAKA